MRVIVSGATGFLGGALCRALKGLGHHVIALGRDQAKLDQLAAIGCRVLSSDLSHGVIETGAADAFVHCAALSSPWGRYQDFVSANVTGTANALVMAKAAGVARFVHISTPSLYFRFEDQLGIREDAPLPPPVNAYAATKAEAEALVLAKGASLDPIILRPRGIYGHGDSALVPRLIATASKRPLPLMRDGRASIDLTHVDDVVGAIVASLHAPKNPAERVFNVSGGQALSVKMVAEAACWRAGVAVRWRAMPVGVVLAVARALEASCKLLPHYPEPPITAYAAGLFAFQQSLNLERAEKILGWTPQVSFEQGLARTFEEAQA